MLAISPTLKLPLDAATQTFAFIARKGAGKTYAAGKLTETLLEAKVQVVILDTVGNWYGLRLSADGEKAGFDIPVFGGLRGDLPIQAQAGELVADVVVDTGRSLILDLSQFSLSDRKRFATAFGERLWKKKKGEAHPTPLMLVIEESQLIIPQFTRVGDDARMVGIYEEIIRLGRNYGIGVTMISQRPQSVNKEVLNQTECLFVLQVNGAQERKALKEWITHQGMDPALLDELPSLPIGTAYVWSPQWLGILQKVEIAKKKTFDASATPKVGDKSVRRNPTPLDLSALEKQMESTIETAKQNDPRELKRQIARLQAEAKKMPAPKIETKEVRVPFVPEKVLRQLDQWAKAIGNLVTELREGAVQEEEPPRRAAAPVRPVPAPLIRPPPQVKAPAGAFGRCERMILAALAQYPEGRNSSQVAILTGYSPGSGGFNNALSNLRARELISRGQPIQITEAGLTALGDNWEPLPTGHALLEYWQNKLGKCERLILGALYDHPEGLTSEELGDVTGYAAGSGGFNNALSTLRTLELIARGQPIMLSETLR